MKKYILIIIILLLSFFENKAQNNQPDALYFLFNNSENKQLNINSFPQTNFILGWQWGGHPRMTEAMKMNCNENWDDCSDFGGNNSNIDINYIWSPGDKRYEESICFIYKPTLTFDNNLNLLNYNDPDHNIFGFRKKDNNINS